MPRNPNQTDQPFRLSIGHWYHGWNIVALATVLVLLTVGLRLGIGPFFFPIADDLGFSRSQLSTYIAIAMLSYGAVMPVAGWIVGRFGTRNTLLAGTLLSLIGGVWTINAHSSLQFVLGFGVILSLGLALVSPVTMTPIVTRWFRARRGMALFFLSTGGMAGLAVATPAIAWGIEMVGWHMTMLGYVIVFAVIAVPGSIFILQERPRASDLPPATSTAQQASRKTIDVSALSMRQALLTWPFWKVTIGLVANGFSMTLLGAHGVPMLIDHGFSQSTSALGVGTIGLVAIAGTVALGRIADKVSQKHMLATVYFVRGVAFIGLLMVVASWQLYAVAIVGGMVWAGSMALSSALLADIYGIQILGVLYGIAYAIQQMAGLVSAWLGGWGFETFHTHWIAFGSSAAILLIACATTLSLPRKGFSYTYKKDI